MWRWLAAATVFTASALAADEKVSLSTSSPQFCSEVQRRLEGTAMTSKNIDHPDYEAFKLSKAEIEPLQTEQFVEYADPAAKKDPVKISCKVKTGDLLNETYGEGTAKKQGSCEAIHRDMADAVYVSLDPSAIRVSRERLVFAPDDVKMMGSQWITPFQVVYAADGKIYLRSKALLVNWNDLKFKFAPDRLRGTHYCHLIAPEYLVRLVTGAATALPRDGE